MGPVPDKTRTSRADLIRLLPTVRAGPSIEEGGETGSWLAHSIDDLTSAGSIASAISNATVHLLSEYTGRGPTKARTYINDELIAIVLQDALTKGERSLVRDGESNLVLANRKAYQNAMRTALVAAVQELSGREVIAFLSDNHIEPDYAVESFILAPREGEKSPDGHYTQAGA